MAQYNYDEDEGSAQFSYEDDSGMDDSQGLPQEQEAKKGFFKKLFGKKSEEEKEKELDMKIMEEEGRTEQMLEKEEKKAKLKAKQDQLKALRDQNRANTPAGKIINTVKSGIGELGKSNANGGSGSSMSSGNPLFAPTGQGNNAGFASPLAQENYSSTGIFHNNPLLQNQGIGMGMGMSRQQKGKKGNKMQMQSQPQGIFRMENFSQGNAGNRSPIRMEYYSGYGSGMLRMQGSTGSKLKSKKKVTLKSRSAMPRSPLRFMY